MRTSAPAATAEESRGAPRDLGGDWTSLRPHEWVPEVPVITREEPRCNSRKTRRFSPERELRPFSTAVSREKSHLPFSAPKGSLTPLRQLKKFTDIHVCTREENQVSRHNSRRPPDLPPHPERRVCFPASSGRESRQSRRVSRGGSLHWTFERTSRGLATISKDPRCPIALQTHLTP